MALPEGVNSLTAYVFI